MALTLRPGTTDDAETLGRILYEAFTDISGRHNYPPDFPSPDAGVAVMKMLLSHPKFYSVVAELDGEIVGSNFVDERSTIAGLGPISVDEAGTRSVSFTLDSASHAERLNQARTLRDKLPRGPKGDISL